MDDLLGFKGKHGVEHFGHVFRLNTKSVTLKIAEGRWRVAYFLLYRVLDGQCDQDSELLIEGECTDQCSEAVQGSLLE